MGIDVSTRRWMQRLVVGLAAASLPVGVGLLPMVLERAIIESASAGPCPDTEVVFARGTGEAPGLGPTGDSFVDALRSRVGANSPGVYPVNYPASDQWSTGIDGVRDAGDSRWPHFGGRVARMRVHSALSLPLIVEDRVIGAINAYATNRDAFGEHAVQLGLQFAGPAAVSVYNAQLLAKAQERTARLQRALDSRAVIDQAIGVIRSRSGSTAEEAFERLTQISQTENVKLYVVAERLVEEAVRRARAWRVQR